MIDGIFEDRFDAARQLVPFLRKYANRPDVIILAIPRGGLELGYVLAKELHLPLDVIFTKKIGFPGNPEYAIGAVSLSSMFINREYADLPELQGYIQDEVRKIRELLKERAIEYRGNKPPLALTNKVVIVVDDGVATGSTLLATIALIKKDKPHNIIVALPVGSADAIKKLQTVADEVLCVLKPSVFYSVGQFYKKFNQVEDATAIRLLQEANK